MNYEKMTKAELIAALKSLQTTSAATRSDAIMNAAENLVSGVLGCWSPCDGFHSPSKEHYLHGDHGTDDVFLMRAGRDGG